VQISGAVVTMESVSHAAELAQNAAVCM
jgi:hypothetical protein